MQREDAPGARFEELFPTKSKSNTGSHDANAPAQIPLLHVLFAVFQIDSPSSARFDSASMLEHFR